MTLDGITGRTESSYTGSDLISRQAAIEEIEKGVWNVNELIERIELLPSADRPTGKWISERSKDWRGGGAEICSECGYGYSWGAYHEPDEFEFCPNCGAKMEANDE